MSTPITGRRKVISQVFVEALGVAVMGAVLAFAANALSPRGLALGRNYFPADHTTNTAAPVLGTNSSAVPTNQPTQLELVATRLKKAGLGLVDRAEVKRLLEDPRYADQRIVFIDARGEEAYGKGHLPGAAEFDYYHPANQIANVLPLCKAAEQVVVYCEGGDCEDSALAAEFLCGPQFGVSTNKVSVYAGGMAEWEASHLPIETGARNSGVWRSQNEAPKRTQ